MPGKCSTFGARPPVPLSDGLGTRPCKILDPRPFMVDVLIRGTSVKGAFVPEGGNVLRDHFIRKAIKGNCPRVNVIGTIWSLQTDSKMAFPVSAGSVAVGGGRHNGCTGILPPPNNRQD